MNLNCPMRKARASHVNAYFVGQVKFNYFLYWWGDDGARGGGGAMKNVE